MLSLSRNISKKDGKIHSHYHITVSSGLDDDRAYGWHLIEGWVIFSTGEVVIAEIADIKMKRNIDPETHALELYLER